MNPEEWIGKSYESELKLDHKIARDFEEIMGRDGFAIETGNKLASCGHWLYPVQLNRSNDFLNVPENLRLYWKEGRVRIESPPYLGDSCSIKTEIRNVNRLGNEEEPTGYLFNLFQMIRSGGRISVEEHISLLMTDNIKAHEQARRIDFEPEWSEEVKIEQLNKLKGISGTFYGKSVHDLLQKNNNQDQSPQLVQAPSAAILLTESFNYHFGSRTIDRIHYEAHSFSSEGVMIVAGRDSDAFVTSMVIMNNRRQVLFSADIRWSYNW